MTSVLDASVGIKWALLEQDTDKARRLRDAYRLGQHLLIAPDWFILEVTNILGKAAARKQISARMRGKLMQIFCRMHRCGILRYPC